MEDTLSGERADDAVKRLHDRRGNSQERDGHAGTNEEGDQDREQQGDASRSSIAGEAVAAAGAELRQSVFRLLPLACRIKTSRAPAESSGHAG
jgi:hypothetical protein